MTGTPVEQAETHLRKALQESSPAEKNYHIRSALQACYLDGDAHEDDSGS